jgi:hypothetical protein
VRPHRLSHLFHPAVAIVAAVALLAGATSPAGADPDPSPYVAPVDGPVIDPFRPPATPYGPGNRGLEYDTVPGAAVRAVGDGEVTFAGQVGGTLAVTVLHPDGLRSSVTYLASIEVHLGQKVSQGDLLGRAGERLHLGFRAGDAYLDPAALLSEVPAHVHLIPFEDPPGTGPAAERRALLGFLGRGLSVANDVASWLRDAGGDAASLVAHYAVELQPATHLVRVAMDLAATGPCTAAGAAPPPAPPGRRVAVLVGGLGSTSDDAAIDHLDTASLGYAAGDVLRFSYGGGRTPDPSDGLIDVAASEYSAADSQLELHASGRRLAELIEAVAAAAPNATIDLFAHSQGGLVERLALDELEERGRLDQLELGLAATIGTPHEGADLATAVAAANAGPRTGAALDLLAAVLPLGLDPDSASVAQLAETSALIDELAATPVPAGVPTLSIGGRGDVIVPAPRTHLAGASNAIVDVGGPTAHDRLPGEAVVTREIALARAGLPPTCETLTDRVLDATTGELIGWAEDQIGAAALVAG